MLQFLDPGLFEVLYFTDGVVEDEARARGYKQCSLRNLNHSLLALTNERPTIMNPLTKTDN